MAEFQDLGDKQEPTEEVPAPKTRYEEMCFSSKKLKGVSSLKLGDEVDLVLRCEIQAAGKGEREYDNDTESEHKWARFIIKQGKIEGVEKEDEADKAVHEEQTYRGVPMSGLKP